MPESARLQYRQCAQNPPTAEVSERTFNTCAPRPVGNRAKKPRFCAATAQKRNGGCDTWVGGIVPQSRLGVFIAIASAFRHPKDTRYVFPARFAQVKHTMTAIFLRASGHLAAHSAPATSLRQQATRPLPHRHEAPTQTTPTIPSRRLSKLRLKLGSFAHTMRAR